MVRFWGISGLVGLAMRVLAVCLYLENGYGENAKQAWERDCDVDGASASGGNGHATSRVTSYAY